MNHRNVDALFLLSFVACGAKPAAEPTAVSVASVTPSGGSPAASSAAPVASAAGLAPGGDTDKAQKARAKADADHRAELARWTPELRAQAPRLADTSYPSTTAALKAVLAGPHRQPGNAERDKYRHPRETLEFFGVQPTSTVLEFGPGGGWYTELLAPALAKRGKLLVTSDDPNGAGERAVYGYRLKLLLDTSPELFGKVESLALDPKSPKIPFDAKLDTVLVIRELHNLVNDGSIAAWLAEFKHALKPQGVLGIVDHRALAGADPIKSSKLGYLPEAWAIEQIEAAGFELSAKSEVNANPKDTKDYPDGVWTLPPTYRVGDKDRAKYAAIGESDRFTLRFVKKDAVPASKVVTPAARADH
jgi:predicted methyltransferase